MTQTAHLDTTRIKKFGDWSDDTWWKSTRDRIPYLGRPEKKEALLTTATYDDYTQYGTIISDTTINNNEPSPWMIQDMPSPGFIWYWINENDCSPNRERGKGSSKIT